MLDVPQWLLTEMHTHVKIEFPNEACGAVLRRKGANGGVSDNSYVHMPMRNVATNPRLEYAWDAVEHRRLYDKAEEHLADMWVIYHSHPETAPEPSETDKKAAWYPGVHYLIFSTAGGKEDQWYQSYVCTEPGELVREEVRVL